MYVLDASAIINASNETLEGITVKEVVEEIKDFESKLLLEQMLDSNRIRVLEPSEKSIGLAVKAIKKTNSRVSNTDMRVLALAIEHQAIVVTDDYNLQNACKEAKIGFQGIIFEGIKNKKVF